MLFDGALAAGEGFPSESGEDGADHGSYDHNPEVAPSSGVEDCGTERTGGVDRAVVDGYAHDVDEAECKTDGEACEFAESLVGVGCSEHYEDEEEGEEGFDE